MDPASFVGGIQNAVSRERSRGRPIQAAMLIIWSPPFDTEPYRIVIAMTNRTPTESWVAH